jgi:hypothetical protein
MQAACQLVLVSAQAPRMLSASMAVSFVAKRTSTTEATTAYIVFIIQSLVDRAASGWMKYEELPRAGRARSSATKLTEHGKDNVVHQPHAARLRAVFDMIGKNGATRGRHIGIAGTDGETTEGAVIGHAHGNDA